RHWICPAKSKSYVPKSAGSITARTSFGRSSRSYLVGSWIKCYGCLGGTKGYESSKFYTKGRRKWKAISYTTGGTDQAIQKCVERGWTYARASRVCKSVYFCVGERSR